MSKDIGQKGATLLFLIKENDHIIDQICLAMKKRGFGVGRYNGVGGKLEDGETPEQAIIRETKEEINVIIEKPQKVAEISFSFLSNPDWDQKVYVYLATQWQNDPTESEEMKPEWFDIKDIPYDQMWPDDIFWLPEIINGKMIRGAFIFDEGDIIVDKQVEIVDKL